MYRDITLREISEQHIGQTLQVAGWVENIRDHGGVSFVDLRDMYGVLQVVMRDTTLLDGIVREMCLSVEGMVEKRDEDTYNPRIPTGTIELEARRVTVLGKVYRQLPFEIMTSKETREDEECKDEGQYRLPLAGDRFFAAEDDRDGISGDPDADPVRVVAGGCARLYCPVQKI